MSSAEHVMPCSGCFEGGEYGQFDSLYPWSDEHRCRIGAGCAECGDTGLTSISIPSDDEIDAMLDDMRKEPTHDQD